MALLCFRWGVALPCVLLLGALSLSRNISMTSRYSLTLMEDDSYDDDLTIPTTYSRDAEYEREGREDRHRAEVRPRLADTATRSFPRTINIDDGASSDHPNKSDSGRKRKRKKIEVDRHTLNALKYIENDKNYPIVDDSSSQEECTPMSAWQSDSYPNCNSIHELDLYSNALSGDFYYVASGGFNDVFRLNEERDSPATDLYPDLIIKMLSPGKKHLLGIPNKREYSLRNYDIVRRDALVHERLTKSSHVQPLYGYCGFSVMVPYADGGTLASVLAAAWSRRNKEQEDISSATRLKYAVDVAEGLADVHDFGVVHADLTVRQYLIRNGSPQLGDFNRGIFLRRNSSAPDTACTFLMTDNYGTTRAPEEYMHKPQTIAVDIWSLGSLLYYLLTRSKVWVHVKKDEAQEAVIRGIRPEIDEAILSGSDPVDKLLLKAFDMCYAYEPSQRATAREVASLLRQGLEELCK